MVGRRTGRSSRTRSASSRSGSSSRAAAGVTAVTQTAFPVEAPDSASAAASRRRCTRTTASAARRAATTRPRTWPSCASLPPVDPRQPARRRRGRLARPLLARPDRGRGAGARAKRSHRVATRHRYAGRNVSGVQAQGSEAEGEAGSPAQRVDDLDEGARSTQRENGVELWYEMIQIGREHALRAHGLGARRPDVQRRDGARRPGARGRAS